MIKYTCEDHHEVNGITYIFNKIANGCYEDINGYQFWYKDGKYHCEDGPAKDLLMQQCWMRNGEFYREDCLPHIETKYGSQYWVYNGKRYRNLNEYLLQKVMG